MERQKQRLFEFLSERSFELKDVVLSSGEKSDYYIDGKMVEVYPEGAYLIGEVLYDQIKDLDVDAIGGIAVGAVPLVTSTVISCYHHDKPIEGFWVREKAKAHGVQKVVEGMLPDKARVVIVDDVVTSGASILKAIDEVKSRGADVVLVLSLVDRERGAREMLSSKGYKYESIFTKQDFFADVQAK